MKNMHMVLPLSVNAIWSSHNLQHVYSHEVPLVLKEFLRVLKANDFALITVPDLNAIASLIAEDQLEDTAYTSPAGPIAPIDMIYGHRISLHKGHYFMAHKTGFTAKSLKGILIRSGFVKFDVRSGDNYDIWAIFHKPAEVM